MPLQIDSGYSYQGRRVGPGRAGSVFVRIGDHRARLVPEEPIFEDEDEESFQEDSEAGPDDSKSIGPFVVKFFGGVILFNVLIQVIGQAGHAWLLAAAFGAVLSGFGAVAYRSGHKIMGAVLVPIGCLFLGFGIMYRSGDEVGEKALSDYLPYAGMVLLTVCGLWLLAAGIKRTKDRAGRYTQPVRGRVIKKDEFVVYSPRDRRSGSTTYYFLTWRYKVNGREYEWESNVGRSSEQREKGNTDVLMVDPSDHCCVSDGHAGYGPLVVMIIAGLCLISGGAACAAVVFGIL